MPLPMLPSVRLPVLAACLLSASPAIASNFPSLPDTAPGLSVSQGVLHYLGHPYTGEITAAWPNGHPLSRTAFQDGLKQGLELKWHESGGLSEVRDYEHGEKAGVHRAWHPNGRRAFHLEFKDGVYHGLIAYWYANGHPASEFHYRNGYETGPQRAWRDNGKLYANYTFKNGRRYGLFNPSLCYQLKNNDQIR